MDFDFYLSEMSVSNHHGGGLTLQRILGEDLKSIDTFFHTGRFATDLPPVPEFADRSIDLISIWETDLVRKLMGRTRANSVSKSSFAIKRHAKTVANKINQKFEKDKLIKGLICPQGAVSNFALEKLKEYRPVKYISWVMDDHLVDFIDGKWQYPAGVEVVFAKHLREAEHVFVISPVMQEFYKNRFGVDSTVLFGSADLLPSKTIESNLVPVKIGYFGAVAAWQMDVLESVVKALTHTNAELHIYSGIEKFPENLKLKGVYFKGRLEPGEVGIVMQQYDAVLLPVSIADKMRNMSEFNIATKMSEYLASGVPIICIGPEYAAMIKYLKANNAAIISTSNTNTSINAAIDLLGDEHIVSEILTNARNLTINETGTLPMRNTWLSGVNV